ncbi:histidine kinase [Eubacteriales bacterium OttesenSCG-928-N13]|nr:histidine kinase [Eubacteriales bacterium OttesenSCG-928-N13]
MKTKRSHSYFTRLLVLCLAVMLLLFGLQTWLFFRYSSEQFQSYTDDTAQKAAVSIQRDVDTYFSNLDKRLDIIYQYPEFLGNLNNDSNLRYERPALNLLTQTTWFQELKGIYVYNNDHYLKSVYQRAKYDSLPDLYAKDDESTEQLRTYLGAGKDRVRVLLCVDKEGKAFLRLVKRLYQRMGTVECGYLVCDLTNAALEQIVLSAPCTQDQYVWLSGTDGTQQYLSPTRNDNVLSLMSLRAAGSDATTVKGGRFFQTDASSFGLSTSLFTDEAQLRTSTQQLLVVLGQIVGVTVLLFLLFGIISSRQVNRRMRGLLRTTQAIGEGHTQERFAVQRYDEIGILCEGFNDMLDRLEVSTLKEARMRSALEEARYRALQSQVNPHFLYNTLDNIGAIAEMQNCIIVGDMCRSLSKLQRYSIQTDMDSKSVMLREELQQVDDYLFIIGVRMQGEVLIERHIEDDVLDTLMPRLSLQPLVENAIRHGLRNKRGEKRLSIEAVADGDDVMIAITDNGDGDEVVEIQKIISGELVKDNDQHTSIGLRNIHERVCMLFGADYGLTAERIDGLTRIALRLPRKEES